MIRTALLLLTLAAPPPDAVTIYVFTAPPAGGFVDAASHQRDDTVADLQKDLRDRKGLAVVDRREDADVVIEVLGRGREDTGRTLSDHVRVPNTGTILSESKAETDARVHVTLSAGEYQADLVGKNDGRIVQQWRTAAKNAAKQIATWVEENRARVLARRTAR